MLLVPRSWINNVCTFLTSGSRNVPTTTLFSNFFMFLRHSVSIKTLSHLTLVLRVSPQVERTVRLRAYCSWFCLPSYLLDQIFLAIISSWREDSLRRVFLRKAHLRPNRSKYAPSLYDLQQIRLNNIYLYNEANVAFNSFIVSYSFAWKELSIFIWPLPASNNISNPYSSAKGIPVH